MGINIYNLGVELVGLEKTLVRYCTKTNTNLATYFSELVVLQLSCLWDLVLQDLSVSDGSTGATLSLRM